MWSPPVTVTPPAEEPVSLEQAKEYLSIGEGETTFDGVLGAFVSAAREHVESVTGTRLAEQTVELRASTFGDLERLPIGPVQDVTGIVYDDAAGIAQTIAGEAFELAGAGLEQGIRPAYGANWPVARAVEGSIRITATIGYTATPGPVRVAILRMVADMFANRETVAAGTMNQVLDSAQIMALLANYRIWL